MRKAAARAFVIALVMNVGLTAFHLIATNWREAAKQLQHRGVLT